MIVRPGPGFQGAVRPLIAVLLLLLVSLAVPFEASQPLHVHEAGTPGLYNEWHVLATLDSLSGAVPMPDTPWAVLITVIAAACALGQGVRPSAPLLSLSDSRAPPVA
jgi:hypothetical protein